MSRVLNTEILMAEASLYGYKLLDKHIKNEKLRIMCAKGHIQKHFPYYFSKAQCKECTKIERANSIKNEIEAKGYTLNNFKGYENNKTLLETICPNGHIRKCKIDSFRKFDCQKCLNEIKLIDLINKVENKGYTIIRYPEDARSVMTASCLNGHIRKAKIYNFINHRCIECQGRKIKYDYEFCKKSFEDKGYTLLETSYIDCKTMMKYICICGEENITTLDIVSHSSITGCSKCKGMRNSGENHYNWKGGITPSTVKIRQSSDYIRWRKDVFLRDEFTCQCCKSQGGSLQAHHILNFSSNEDIRMDINNGITLCYKCHSLNQKGSFHSVYGTRDNNKEQLDEYILNHRQYQGLI